MATASNSPMMIEQWLDARPMRPVQWLVVVASGVVAFVDGFDLQTLALAIPAMSADWGVAPERLAWPLSLSLLGMGIGAAFLGMAGDRIGRKLLICGSLLLVGASCAATAAATNVTEIGLYRLLTGIGIGGANINALALNTEFVPPRRRFLMMMLMGCNMAVGAASVGLFAPSLIGKFGWEGFFIVGAGLALVLALAIFVFVPEAPAHLLAKGDTARTARVLRRIDAAVDPSMLLRDDTPEERLPLAVLMSRAHRQKTLVLWSVYLVGTFILYLISSWLPVLLIDAGWAPVDAYRGAVVVQVGGIVGSILAAVFIDRGYLVGALLTLYALAGLALGSLAIVPPTVLGWNLLIFLIGFGISGTQLVLLGATAALYPERMRATSAGWATAIARGGAIAAPLAGGAAMSAGIAPSIILSALAVPMLCQFLTVLWARHSFVR